MILFNFEEKGEVFGLTKFEVDTAGRARNENTRNDQSMKLTMSMFSTWALATVLSIPTVAVQHDTFTFDNTDWKNHVYGPEDWINVQCHDITDCSWPTNWENFHEFIPYEGMDNMCHDCSTKTNQECKRHQQSPINMNRNVTGERTCRDRHKMHYVPGNCRFGRMDFQILPHVLRAYQPEYCQIRPNIDYSMGFPDPWLLMFTDITVPSHHTIEGHQFSAEVFLSHVYSTKRANKLIGNVAVLLEEGTPDDHYDFLQLYIKRFRQERWKTRDQCRSQSPSMSPSTDSRRKMQANDPLISDYDEAVDDDEDFDDSWIEPGDERDLTMVKEMDYVHKPPHYSGWFHPYKWVSDVDTTYYFRYNGSMPEPPCIVGVHWRVMQIPIKVSPKQISDLHDLLLTRLDPITCEYENAGKPNATDPKRLSVNRPLQTVRNAHKLVYCECTNWKSRKRSDRKYCRRSFEQRGVVDPNNL